MSVHSRTSSRSWWWIAVLAPGCASTPSVSADAARPVDVVTADQPDTPPVVDHLPADAVVDAEPEDAGLPPLDYARDEHWLCRPGLADDRCLTLDLSATELRPDGTRATVTSTPAADPAYDCFYVYPTVDLTSPPGNRMDLSNVDPMLDPLVNQAARFREQCRVFAPLYRQVTLLGLSGAGAAARREFAYRDVEAAFREFLRRSAGRPFVLMGHSQGSFMSERLITDVIARDEALRARLIVALLVGGSVQVPVDATRGGSLGDFPLCTSEDQTGCAVAYHTFGAGYEPTPGGTYPSAVTPGREFACNNPAALGMSATAARARAAYFPTSSRQALFSVGVTVSPPVSTPFVLLRDFYTAACASNASLRSYLVVRAQPSMGDARVDPVPYGHVLFAPSFLGLHVLDFNFVLGDLQALVARKAARHLAGS